MRAPARASLAAIVGVAATLVVGAAPAAAAAWPLDRLELGLSDQPDGAREIARGHRVGLRYQYLAGGVNTEQPWTTWGDRFVEDYVRESRAAGLIPVFTYYEIRQSLPGGTNDDEPNAVLSNLVSPTTMRSYWANVRELFMRLGQAGGPVVVHVEPDLWGYLQQRFGDDASAAPVTVAASGAPGLGGLPDTAAGMAQAFVRLRDELAPQVTLAWHVSVWGTNRDIAISNDPPRVVDGLAARSAAFYRSLGAPFDAVFSDPADRDSGFAVQVNGAGRSAWWSAADFTRHLRFVRGVRAGTGLPMVLWQIPLGNTRMRSVNDTWGHFQDNRPEWFLDGRRGWAHLRATRDAGVAALLFGGGQAGDTAATDAMNDGVTNPAPINGNRRRARVADDDGGYFRERSRAYRHRGPLKLAR
jgi:hypothetical protein